jgi:hypothetical protein
VLRFADLKLLTAEYAKNSREERKEEQELTQLLKCFYRGLATEN